MDGKLNVCLLNDSFPPLIDGVSNAVVNYATIIQEKYGEATVVTPEYPDTDDSGFPFAVERYPSIDTTKLVGYRAGNALDLNSLSKYYEKNFDILHSHCPVASTYMARLIREGVHKPVVLTYHTKFDIDIKRAINSRLIQQSAINLLISNVNACDDVWCVSRGAGENLRSLGYNGSYTVMSNGVDFEKGKVFQKDIDAIRAEYGIRSDVPVYLFVGRMMWYKGIRIILDALRILKSHGNDFQMVFVGEGGDFEEILRYTVDLQLEENCLFTGAIRDREKLKTLYCAVDLFLFPSTFDTNGLVVREAAASGIASVLVKDSCAAEDVTDGLNAILIDENAESMAQVLMNPDNNVDYYHRLGDNAMNQLYCSWEQAVDKAYDRYLYVIEKYKDRPVLDLPHLFDGFFDAWGNLATGIKIVNQMQRSLDKTVSETSQRINDFINNAADKNSRRINDFVDSNFKMSNKTIRDFLDSLDRKKK
ncbi:MAG: glycosyltransferase [Erysipelotrichaceae bacterium]|nr:glycosyltransferase [Erysipelotrichaceae bacterium]